MLKVTYLSLLGWIDLSAAHLSLSYIITYSGLNQTFQIVRLATLGKSSPNLLLCKSHLTTTSDLMTVKIILRWNHQTLWDQRSEKFHLAQGCCEGLMGAVEAGSELGTDAFCQFGSTETFYGVLGHFPLPLWRDGRRVHKRYPVDYLGARQSKNTPSKVTKRFETIMADFISHWPVWFAPRRALWQRILNEKWPPHDRRHLITVSGEKRK